MSNIVLIGGGNQAHYVLDIIHKEGIYNVVGIIDSIHDIGSIRFDYPIIGREGDLPRLIKEYKIVGGIISIGDNWSRYYVKSRIVEELPTFKFINAIHPSVIIGSNVHMGMGVTAMAGCIINPRAVIGDFTFFATGAQIEHDCVIGDFASISAGTVLGGHVKVGEYSALTLGVTVFDRIEIGRNTVVGAGSLVTKSLPNDVVVYGSPAKIIRSRIEGEKFLK